MAGRSIVLINGHPAQPIPTRMEETWEWVCAVVSYDLGDPNPLATLICAQPIPIEFRAMVGDVVRGDRPVSRKRQSNSKIPASDWLTLADQLSAETALGKFLHSKNKIAADADLFGIEPITNLRSGQAAARNWKRIAAAEIGVSSETIEDMLRIFQRLISAWPAIPPVARLRRPASRKKR